jgi:hypothetical protein
MIIRLFLCKRKSTRLVCRACKQGLACLTLVITSTSGCTNSIRTVQPHQNTRIVINSKQTLQQLNMPLQTHANDNFSPLFKVQKGHVVNIKKQIYFFDVFNQDRNIKPFRQICRNKTVNKSTKRL